MTDERVYGMGVDRLVEPDWPPPTSAEIAEVLGTEAVVDWHSPRPLSATARARTGDGRAVIVKRLPLALRSPAALEEEHRFMDHLRAHGIPIPAVLDTRRIGEFTYEVQEFGTGTDRYQGVFSWSPYLSSADAAAAGRALARLHTAAAEYDAPHRPPHPLQASFTIFASADPIGALERQAAVRPALGIFLSDQPWRTDVERVHMPVHARLFRTLADLEPLWTHNDWHGTNLLWHDGEVSSVIDFGLADRTTSVHDLAIAIERSAVDWLALRDGDPVDVRLGQVRALLDGYESLRPLDAVERRALPELLPLVHCEYELSEIDYFLGVVPGGNQANAEIAYHDYFLGHTRWWEESTDGQALLDMLRSR
ncbi:phosphotransferase [Nocardia otitidiscaviarum]|uniref:Phosphotransferase n=1 Tax=Nocardia otitidiscaviarum TaxID=1823 RepID=A0A516NVD1_9NOCA|nr:phosphotransferase [Nocardia otitidiscaviarum]MCP9622319.1 phosphotransferase [Nocardia otitidiscaviarum]QDP82857.1 phosphotransferase [Nocardia otitidiscaviarum]